MSRTSHVLAQAAGGAYIGTDERSGDSVIRVGPSGETKPGTRMYMDRNLGPDDDSGDRVIHVVPPPEERQESEVLFGPLLITPEITWPGNTKPGMTRPDMTKPDPRVPHGRMPREQTAPGKRD
ncbi:hypothetical protein [Desulfonatronum thiodismutans]|uniref:hypothetical protein n=1 Tax=Desulfonatronum thiodismutans TaxID=159290 RepID=UPI001268936B|nr:hypothetical protein [Desulfonatronum thiodismutans]